MRRWYLESGEGRSDVDGVEWFVCDGYPTWYRWEDGVLVTPEGTPNWPPEKESSRKG